MWHFPITVTIALPRPCRFLLVKGTVLCLFHPCTYSLLTAAYSQPQDAACPHRVRCCCSCKSFAETFIISEKYLRDLKTVYLQTVLTVSSSHPSHSAPAWVRPTDVNSVKPLGERSLEHLGFSSSAPFCGSLCFLFHLGSHAFPGLQGHAALGFSQLHQRCLITAFFFFFNFSVLLKYPRCF